MSAIDAMEFSELALLRKYLEWRDDFEIGKMAAAMQRFMSGKTDATAGSYMKEAKPPQITEPASMWQHLKSFARAFKRAKKGQ